MKKILLYGLLAAITGNAFAEPAITGASATGTTIKFTVQLSEKLFSGYKVKIDLNNGKGLAAMKCSALTCTLSSSVLPKGVGDASYSVGIYDSKGALQGETVDSSYVITTTAEVNTVPTSPTFSYSKISNSGATLPATAKLGTGTTDWACTKDTQTGLTWEVKTTDDGLRDYKNSYSWYEPDASKNGGDAGYQNGNDHPDCKGSQCDTYAFTKAVNAKGLCGKKDWRMPTVDELEGLLTKTDTVNQPFNKSLYIDATYFPNTNYGYWSSSPSVNYSSKAWYVFFYAVQGYSDAYVKSNSSYVRLVRG